MDTIVGKGWGYRGGSGSPVEVVGVKETFLLTCYLHSINVPLFFKAKAWRVENQNMYLPDWSLLFSHQFFHDGKQIAFCFTSPVSCPPSPTERLHGFTAIGRIMSSLYGNEIL